MTRILPVLILASVISLNAEIDSLRASYGIFVNFSLNLHDADFRRIPDCPSCSPGFLSGSGAGLSIGGLYEYPLAKDYSIAGRFNYMNLSGLLKSTEEETVIIDDVRTEGEFEHTLDADLSIIGIEPHFIYKFDDRLSVNAGLNISSIQNKSYSQKEQIVKPANRGTFIDENGNDTYSRTRNEFSGEMEKAASLYFGLIAGISYRFQMNSANTISAFPELSFMYGLSNIIDDPLVNKWAVNSFRAGVSIKYTPEPRKEKIPLYEEIKNIDTVIIESDEIASLVYRLGIEQRNISKNEDDEHIIETVQISRTDTIIKPIIYKIEAMISAVGLDSNMSEVKKPKFIIEEFTNARLQPLLNYVFFDSLSSDISKRFSRLSESEATRFSVDSLFDLDVISTYRNLLNIYGKRMKDHPDAVVTLTGCNDGVSEKDNLQLSLSRAESIKNYLTEVWKIQPERIVVKSRNLPEKASTPLTDFEKAQENRRVEIVSNNPEITKPVFSSFSVRTTSLPGIRFKPEGSAEAGLKKWEVQIFQDGTELKNFAFSDKAIKDVDWLFAEDRRNIPVLDKPLEFVLNITDNKDNTENSARGTIEIEQITVQKKRSSGLIDRQVDNYSLILFDFAKSDLESANKDIVNFVKSRLSPNSKVEITGYTDRTGDDQYNKKLSERRALTVFNELRHKGSTYKGVGEDLLLYDNDFPEGRFYCRTINIRVETEIK